MLIYPEIDPVALSLGPIKIHWYGLMYLLGFGAAFILGTARSKKKNAPMKSDQISDMVYYCALGLVLGGRLGYVIFYDLFVYIDNPIKIFQIWQGGMSFHGGMLGVIAGSYLYARKIGISFFTMTDFIAPLVPIGLFFGRIGNFINGELWGRITDGPFGMIIVSGMPARHPSQLYEAALEGLALFAILWIYSKTTRPKMAVSGLFLLCYGCFRFLVEFVRTPDEQLGYIAFNWLTMGQILTAPMILLGLALITIAYKNKSSLLKR